MARGDALPAGDETTRWIKKKFVGHDDTGKVEVDAQGRPTTVAPAAFELRDDEDGLSLTWLQRFGLTRQVHLPVAAESVRQSLPSKNLGSNSAFGVGAVRNIQAAGAAMGHRLRILHDPIEGNDGHTEVRRYPAEVGLLQTMLANDIFAERYLYSNIKVKGWQP